MIRRPWLPLVLLGTAAVPAGCLDTTSPPSLAPQDARGVAVPAGVNDPAEARNEPGIEGGEVEGTAILKSALHLIQTAGERPGGNHFNQAIVLLDRYFADARPEDFALGESARSYLAQRLPPRGIEDLESSKYTVRDARHIEDCFLYQSIAMRAAGDGEDLVRVGRVFDWIVRQVQLVPAGSLAPEGLPQAPARPFDILLRGMATEEGNWAERSWLFLALCRQLELDAGLLYLPPRDPPATLAPVRPEARADGPRAWACAVLIDGTPYLFDAAYGTPIPGPGGQGIATLEQAATDPSILARLDLPERPYPVRSRELSGARLGVWIDSTLGYLSPRMRNLQRDLVGKQRMVLSRDPAEQAEAFAAALGDRFHGCDLWDLPMDVEYRLFNDPGFVQATQYPLGLFDSRLPLLGARMKQLRGEFGGEDGAIQRFVLNRFREDPLQSDGKTPIAPGMQAVLDLYYTHFLALAKLDQGAPKLAEGFFQQALTMLPEPGAGLPFYYMYRWGAEANLARINEDQGEIPLAIRYYARPDPTPQQLGERLRARELIWRDPFVPPPGPLPVAAPPAPESAPPLQARADAPAAL